MNAQDAHTIDTDFTRQAIASNVAAELKRQRWTGRSAAMALGLSQPYVSRRLTGDTELSGSDLVLFASFLKVPVSRFFVLLPDLDSNQEPPRFKSAPVSLASFRSSKLTRARTVLADDHDATITTLKLNA